MGGRDKNLKRVVGMSKRITRSHPQLSNLYLHLVANLSVTRKSVTLLMSTRSSSNAICIFCNRQKNERISNIITIVKLFEIIYHCDECGKSEIGGEQLLNGILHCILHL